MPPKKKLKQQQGAEQQKSLNAFFASPGGGEKGKGKETVNGKREGKVNGKAKQEERGAAGRGEIIDLDSPEPEVNPQQQLSTAQAQQKRSPKKEQAYEIIDIDIDIDSPPPPPQSSSAASPSKPRKNPLFIPSTPSKRAGKEPTQLVGLMSPHDREEKHAVGKGTVKVELVSGKTGAKKNPFASATAPSSSTSVTTTINASTTTEPLQFDTDPLLFDPSSLDLESSWKATGGRLPYEVLVRDVYVPVAGTRKRLAIGRVLVNFLRTLIYNSPQDLLPTIYLLSNHLAPSYIPTELGVGFQILNKAITDVSGVNREGLKRLWDRCGDPGDVAFEAKSNLRTLIRPAPLPAHKLYTQLLAIARTKGSGAGKAKGEIVRKLLVQVKGEEVRYLVTLLSAMARAFSLTRSATAATASGEDSPYHVTQAELDAVMRAGPSDAKGKGKAKVEPEVEAARERVEGKLVAATALVRKVYLKNSVRHPNYDDILAALLERGFDDLSDRVPLSVGIPLSPMLGSITRSLAEVFTRLGTLPFTSEAKLDGQRVQVHARVTGPSGKPDGGGRWVEASAGGEGGVGAKRRVWVRLFSRHLEDMTEKYPDVCELVAVMLANALPAVSTRPEFPRRAGLTPPNDEMSALAEVGQIDSFIMDAEIVAVDKDTGAYRTFQELSNRAKKDVQLADVKVVVGVFAFDLMLVNDNPLLSQPFSIRRHLLRTLFPPFANPEDATLARFAHVESIDSTSPADVQAFFEQVVAQKCEGLMVKLLESGEGLTGDDDDAEAEDDGGGGKRKRKTAAGGGGTKKPLPSTYEPDARSQGWLKVKKDYLEGMGDSLDLVPIGAWWGLGRKAGWYSPILLALYNPETGALEAVCKCISGFSDAFYKDLLVRFPPEGSPDKCRKTEPFTYVETGGLRPDMWFEPSEVWEIRGADISLSPVYTAAASHLGSERGLSIRFPRFIRRREDKSWEEATTAEQFAEMYRKQAATGTSTQGTAVAEAEAVSEEEELEE
ncbi:hypothetical protein QFC21_003366 [Naganishia friedmannii]|uniref:Uncharacterized protein n=1 Tax=Naganishia friedmannii TaxID=89922 RepID=A0ACC2VPX8_9TREE|nr:hypothetical protein QFC21_003366 [Naganishia friedmannii]